MAEVLCTPVAPCTDDMIVSKLARLVEKDREYIFACHDVRGLDIGLIKSRFSECQSGSAFEENAFRFLDGLPVKPVASQPSPVVDTPPYPEGTHAAFLSKEGHEVVIREWDPDYSLYLKRGNTMGHAIVDGSSASYAINDKLMSDISCRSSVGSRDWVPVGMRSSFMV